MNRTHIDWWSWRSKAGPEGVQKALQRAVGDVGHLVTLTERRGGYQGYERSATVCIGDIEAGLVAWGGENQKGWSYASLSGEGCSWVEDWDLAQEAAEECEHYQARRVDVALDMYRGESSFDATLGAYRAGGFSPAGQGRPPKCEPMKPEREQDSAIIRIGDRASNKYLRGYEKGKQVMGPAIAAAMKADPEAFDWGAWVMHREARLVDGQVLAVAIWDWWRMELELKPKTAPLPEDVIDRRDQYFAGAYPYLGQVLQDVEPEALIMRRDRGPQLELALALAHIRKQFGATLFTACSAHHGDFQAVWAKIVGRKHNARLLRAGVLMVDHDDTP